ncbi:hypothetical protein RJ639_018927 [Escallonia herrerae]|uniref:Reverse transcriptase Ty1/copia-type domain-containing protein n=1 Tax=Escallonia herrerae TaxID=1293975 RepID=A0AA88V6V3_9ASTE|nr:hypothetical protein RJ639_018927 [Escallonia herrerae]
MHMPDEKWSKLDDKSEKYVFIGRDSRSKGYKLYNPSNGKIVVSRDVIFHEKNAWEWNIPQENYNTIQFLNVEEQEDDDMKRAISPPSSPQASTKDQASPTSSESPPRCTTSLWDIYDETKEHVLYAKVNGDGDILLVCLYVDDLILTGNNPSMLKEFENAMAQEFKMKDIDLMSYYLGIEWITEKAVELKYVKSQDQVADIFTKPLEVEEFCKLEVGLESKIKFKREC